MLQGINKYNYVENSENIKNGYLKLVIGPMYASKTETLIATYHKYKYIYNNKIVVLNYIKDTRYGKNVVSTHYRDQVPAICLENLNNFIKNDKYTTSNVILIDESQFFDDLKEFVLHAVEKDNKCIIVFGLNGDFKRKKFGHILDLIPYADDIEKLSAFCTICSKENKIVKAHFSKRIIENDEQEMIGNEDKYIAVCRKHYNE